MEAQISTLGATLGLVVAIVAIILKAPPVYSLLFGALVGGIAGCLNLQTTVDAIVAGAGSMTPAALRVLTSGILAGALIRTGSAEAIAETMIQKCGEKRAIVAICLSTCVICAAGVFIDVAVITAAPIALTIGRHTGYSKSGVLLAMIGGGKAGNICSPNPNAITTADIFGVDLSSLIARNIVPALIAIVVTILVASWLAKKTGDAISETDCEKTESKDRPKFLAAILGPIVIVVLLALRPIFGLKIDPLLALPIGGFCCVLATRKTKNFLEYSEYGLKKVIGVTVLLISAGAIAGVVKASSLQTDAEAALAALHLPTYLLAPFSGVLMGGATASTTAGATVASQAFATTLVEGGVSSLAAAAMIHAGATVVDSLPHGSFFHATGGIVHMPFSTRMKLIPYEALVGFSATLATTAIYIIFGK